MTEFVSVKEAAKILRTTEMTVHRHRKELGAFKIGRVTIVPRKNLKKFKRLPAHRPRKVLSI